MGPRGAAFCQEHVDRRRQCLGELEAMAGVLHTLTARSITYVTFSDSDALAAEHDVVLCLEAGGAWNLSADSRGITA